MLLMLGPLWLSHCQQLRGAKTPFFHDFACESPHVPRRRDAMRFALGISSHQTRYASCVRLVAFLSACATAGLAAAEQPELIRGPDLVQRHERASSWRTVVVPVVVATPTPVAAARPWGMTSVAMTVPTPMPATRAPLTTASLSPPIAPAKPLVGVAHAMTGLASYYWQDQMTSSGERFNKRAMTAAHKTLPLGTRVLVTHVASGRTVIVRINDRGPFKPGRVIDLSEAAAEAIQMTGAGLAQVRIDVVR
jgi:rare lipoprotein A